MHLLRRMKSEAALLIALCDIGGVWPVMRVTAALTDLAIASVQTALRFLLRQEVARGRMTAANARHAGGGLRPDRAGDGQDGRGRTELFQRHRPHRVLRSRCDRRWSPTSSRRRSSCASTQALARLLQQRSGDGYVFRVDLRLRPDPASTQVAISTDAALHYYEREGRTWERAAMIKARPCAGDAKAGEALVAELAPFVWRKHLDFAALADVHDMKRQMQTYRGQSEIAVEGHNVKVGRGGIREIEFFAQTQQLIAGGRHPRIAGAADAGRARDSGDQQLDHLPGARRTDGRLRVPAPGRAPAADDRGRADPCAARRRRGHRAFCELLRLREPRGLRQGSARPSEHRAGALQQAVRGRSDRLGETAAGQLRRRTRRSAACSNIWRRSASRSRSWWPARCSSGCEGNYRALRNEATKARLHRVHSRI